MKPAQRRAAAANARAQRAMRERELARWRMARDRRAGKQIHEFYRAMAILDGGATDDDSARAAATLSHAPRERQGRLL